MGSFAGVNIDAQNLQQAVSLAEQKKLLAEQARQYQLSQSLLDYRNSLSPVVSDVKVAIPQYDSYNSKDKLNAIESTIETKRRNENKTKIIIIGAFILGYLLSKN
jgi:hypothetical protein